MTINACERLVVRALVCVAIFVHFPDSSVSHGSGSYRSFVDDILDRCETTSANMDICKSVECTLNCYHFSWIAIDSDWFRNHFGSSSALFLKPLIYLFDCIGFVYLCSVRPALGQLLNIFYSVCHILWNRTSTLGNWETESEADDESREPVRKRAKKG